MGCRLLVPGARRSGKTEALVRLAAGAVMSGYAVVYIVPFSSQIAATLPRIADLIVGDGTRDEPAYRLRNHCLFRRGEEEPCLRFFSSRNTPPTLLRSAVRDADCRFLDDAELIYGPVLRDCLLEVDTAPARPAFLSYAALHPSHPLHAFAAAAKSRSFWEAASPQVVLDSLPHYSP